MSYICIDADHGVELDIEEGIQISTANGNRQIEFSKVTQLKF